VRWTMGARGYLQKTWAERELVGRRNLRAHRAASVLQQGWLVLPTSIAHRFLSRFGVRGRPPDFN